MATMSFIKGPFVFKSDIIIPAGTPYTTKDPKNPGTQFTKRQITNRVQSPPYRGFAQQFADALWVDPPIVEVGTWTTWFKYIEITEELLRANGFEPEYEDVKILETLDRFEFE